jgi:hypothetical protein
MTAQKPLQKKAAPEAKQSKGYNRQQLVEGFLLLALIVTVVAFGLMVYWSEPIPPKMVHVEKTWKN